MALARLLPAGEPPVRAAVPGAATSWSTIPAGPFELGAAADGFAYDNERPRHARRRSRRSRSAAAGHQRDLAAFAEGGGYERREWWSDEGWAWKEEYDITHHAGGREAGAARDAPVVPRLLVRGRRLRPRAAGPASPPRPSGRRRRPGTRDSTGDRAGVGVDRVARSPATRASCAHPYREYSEVFFGDGYRVLRGGSWATHPRVATPTFRNWDLPERRQIFAGVGSREER